MPKPKNTLANLPSIQSLHSNTPYPSKTWYKYIYTQLKESLNNPQETEAITTQILTHYLGYNTTKHILNTPLQADPPTLKNIIRVLQRLKKHEPLQYILGHTTFLGHPIQLTQGVFIPRSETEQMVHHITEQKHPAKNILDLCTGSGCIAIALQKAYPHAQVHAVDIDPRALATAQKNAQKNHCHIHLSQCDILNQLPPIHPWDLIVSNPPYIPQNEKKQIHPNVLHYEPHQALFVPNKNPLIFYQRIAQIVQKYLQPKGYLYVEIHEDLSNQTASIFQKKGFRKVTSYKDLHNKNRWIACQK